VFTIGAACSQWLERPARSLYRFGWQLLGFMIMTRPRGRSVPS
jgi:hypothetical protein